MLLLPYGTRDVQGNKIKGGGKIYVLNKYTCAGKLKKIPQKSKKKAGSDSPEIVFHLAELSHLQTEVSRPREMSRFLEFTKRNHRSPGVVITGN